MCVLDLVFVVDSSFLLDATKWAYVVNFTSSIAQYMTVGPTTVNIGYVTYGTNPTARFFLSTYGTTSAIVNAINAIPLAQDFSNEAAALNYLTTTMFTTANGDRYWINNAAVVVSAVTANSGGSPVNNALLAQAAGIKIFSVGIQQDGASLSDVYNISSPPRQQNNSWFMVPTYQQLSQYVGPVYSALCPGTCACKYWLRV